jgi:hypothetical protein
MAPLSNDEIGFFLSIASLDRQGLEDDREVDNILTSLYHCTLNHFGPLSPESEACSDLWLPLKRVSLLCRIVPVKNKQQGVIYLTTIFANLLITKLKDLSDDFPGREMEMSTKKWLFMLMYLQFCCKEFLRAYDYATESSKQRYFLP